MRVLLVFIVALSCSPALSAQEPSTSPTDTSPEASAPSSQQLASIAERLSQLSSQLLSEADASLIDSAELKSSLEESRNALLSCQQSLEAATKKDKRRSVELWLWRGAAAIGLVAGAVGLGYGLSR